MYLQDILWSIGIWKNFSEDTVKHEDMFSLMMEGNVEEETAQEKRLRLAKEYLSQLEDKGKRIVKLKCVQLNPPFTGTVFVFFVGILMCFVLCNMH
jgi:hypothetical protein